MKEHTRPRMRPWIFLLAVIGLVAGHVVLYYGLSHAALSAAVLSGLILVIVINISDCSVPCTHCSDVDLALRTW